MGKRYILTQIANGNCKGIYCGDCPIRLCPGRKGMLGNSVDNVPSKVAKEAQRQLDEEEIDKEIEEFLSEN